MKLAEKRRKSTKCCQVEPNSLSLSEGHDYLVFGGKFPHFGRTVLGQIRIDSPEALTKAIKKAHKQVQIATMKLKTAKKEVAILRKSLDDKIPDTFSQDEKKMCKIQNDHLKMVIDGDLKGIFFELEDKIKEYHRTLSSAMR